jgi:phage terminase large subunit GpA-like protein
MQVGPFMRQSASGRFFHWCPACEMAHALPADNGWTYNGNPDAPTFTPSFRQMRVRDGKDCHYNITNGMIVWHNDSWHGRRGMQAMIPLKSVGVDDGDALAWLDD